MSKPAAAKASTEGLDTPTAAQGASGTAEASNANHAQEATKAPEPVKEANGSAVTTQQPPAPPADPEANFPSPDVRYSDMAAESAYLGLQRFQRGLATLNSMKDGTEQRYRSAVAELDAKYEADRASLTHKFEDEVTALEPRIDDMQAGIDMYTALLDKAEQLRIAAAPNQEKTDDATQG